MRKPLLWNWKRARWGGARGREQQGKKLRQWRTNLRIDGRSAPREHSVRAQVVRPNRAPKSIAKIFKLFAKLCAELCAKMCAKMCAEISVLCAKLCAKMCAKIFALCAKLSPT